jgi:hypothetical protein
VLKFIAYCQLSLGYERLYTVSLYLFRLYVLSTVVCDGDTAVRTARMVNDDRQDYQSRVNDDRHSYHQVTWQNPMLVTCLQTCVD